MRTRELAALRGQIDEADRELVAALVKRYDIVRQVGTIKQAQGIAVYDPKREGQVLDKVARLAGRPEYAAAVKAVYQTIMDEAKKLEK